jgi:hypothetical protein
MKIDKHCRRHVEAWRQSELSQADYCRQHGINPKTFSRWTRLELARDKDAPLDIIPIHIVRSAPAAASTEANVILHLAQGAQLELSTAVSPRWLAELLRCLA